MITLRRSLMIALVCALLFVSFLAGHATGYQARPALAAEKPAEFEIFWEAWNLVHQHFVDREKLDTTQMTYGAIEGMLSSLGDEGHTTFLSPEAVEAHQNRLQGSFEGIGAYVSLEDGEITVVAPITGSPAEEAGILPGDVILAVDGESVHGLSLNEVVSKILGPANTEVTLTVRHADDTEAVDITIVRQKIELNSVQWSLVPGTGVAYIQITQFASDTSADLENALKEIRRTRVETEPVQGLILDLRNNPGGYLSEAIRVGSQFLPTGEVILMERNAEQETSVYKSFGWGYGRSIPMVVLINEGTASAGEITAGAIKENGRGKLIGQTTFGTGTVLNQFNLSDGSAILLGVTNWLTPKGNLIKGQGVEPDVSVELTTDTLLVDAEVLTSIEAEELFESEDEQFLQALELLAGPLPSQESTAKSDSTVD